MSGETQIAMPLVRVRGLTKQFHARGLGLFATTRPVVAVDDVSFDIPAGTTFGLVGESGSGKTTVAKMMLKLEKPSSGAIEIAGRDIAAHDASERAAYRRMVQAVLQDPYGALSPRLRVRDIVGEPMRAQGETQAAIDDAVPRLLESVGLAREAGARYPHQFSGGQRQRVAIARAISVNPRLLVLDEPVSALDESIRAQILNLLVEMQARLGLTYLFIGHDLAIVNHISTSVGVMYFGRMVEIGPADSVLGRPLHPYTRRLVTVASMREPFGSQRLGSGELPDPHNPPSGCHFRTRCRFADAQCAAARPALRPAGDGHQVACHHFEAIEAAQPRAARTA